MVPHKLRIVVASGESVDVSSTTTTSPAVSVRLEEVFPVLAEALESGRTWLDDFAEEKITLSRDLYEVLLAYQHHRRAA